MTAASARAARRQLAIVLAVAGILRLGLFAAGLRAPDRFLDPPDSAEYERLATNLAGGHGFSQAAGPPYRPDLRRTPVYPAILAGLSILTSHLAAAAILLNVVLGVAITGFVHQIARGAFGLRAGALSALVFATDLTSLAYGTSLLAETTFAFLVTLALVVMVQACSAEADRRRREGHGTMRAALSYGVAGILLGVAALCRPIGLALGPALLPLCIVRAGWSGWRNLALTYALLNVGFFAVLSLWIARNVAVFGVFSLTSVGAANLYFHRAAFVQAELENADVEQVRRRWELEFEQRSAHWTEAQKQEWLGTRGGEIIRAHPALYARLTLRALGRMLAPERERLLRLLGIPPESRWAAWLALMAWLQLLGIYVCAARGVSALFIRRGSDPLFAGAPRMVTAGAGVLVAYFLLLAGPETYARFRAPLMPFLAILAGAGAPFWWDQASAWSGDGAPGNQAKAWSHQSRGRRPATFTTSSELKRS